jgi:putative spermidine/putrescine transport system substrate-binding protein
MSYKKSLISLIMLLGILVLTACGPTATPETIKEEVEVTRIAKETVIVEKEVTPELEEMPEENVVVVRVAGGSFGQANLAAYFSGFEAETGIEVLFSPGYGTAAQIKAQHDLGIIEWDVVMQGPADAYRNGDKGYLEEFDYSKIDAELLDDIPEDFQRKYGPVNHVSGRVLAYRTDVFPGDTGPKSWADFWDVDSFPGPRALFSGYRGEGDWEFALLADGVPLDELYPLDMDRVFTKLDEIKPHIIKWWESGGESTDMLVSGDVVMTDVWNGRIQPAIDAGEPIRIVWNGGLITTGDWCVMADAPHRENAYKFINYALRPENQAILSQHLPYGTSNTKALENLDEETLSKLPTAPENFENTFLLGVEFYLEPYEGYDTFSDWATDYWAQWVEQ